jgi:hypothetical protein
MFVTERNDPVCFGAGTSLCLFDRSRFFEPLFSIDYFTDKT